MTEAPWLPGAGEGGPPRALSIAGSDSGGGAGIQADLKTFAAFGVHGMTAVTAVTAQHTAGVTAVAEVPPEVVAAQIEACASDIGVDAGKTGMLASAPIVEAVAEAVRRWRFPLVVDPVMASKSGAPLLAPEAQDALVRELFPLATVITPNAREAAILAGRPVASEEEAREAARALADLGPAAVIVKGGHLPGDEVVDLFFYEGRFTRLTGPRHPGRTTHGTGCTFSAAIAAGLARGWALPDAVERARHLVAEGIRLGLPVGQGFGPVNPLAGLYRDAMRHEVLRAVEEAAARLAADPALAGLCPEVGINLAYALPGASGPHDIAAIEGRVVRAGERLVVVGPARFGASSHLARGLVVALRSDPARRAMLNLAFREEVVAACAELGWSVASYDRTREPPRSRAQEGGTLAWGVAEAIRAGGGRVPDLIFHRGDWGKEPMVNLLARTPAEAVERARALAARLAPAGAG